MTLPQKITDAIDAYRDSVFAFASDGVHSEPNPVETRAALERAIAEHTSSLVRQIPTAFMGEVPKDHRFVIAIKDASIGRELSKWSRDVASLRADLGTVYQTLTRQKGHEAGPEFGSSEQAAATRSWNGGPTVTALMRGVEDAAIEWGKCVGDYNAACQAAPPPSGLEASEAVREAGHKCELAYGYFQKAIKALADHRATPAPSALERLRERVQHEFDGCDTSRSNTSFTRGQTLGSVLDWIDEEREAGHG